MNETCFVCWLGHMLSLFLIGLSAGSLFFGAYLWLGPSVRNWFRSADSKRVALMIAEKPASDATGVLNRRECARFDVARVMLDYAKREGDDFLVAQASRHLEFLQEVKGLCEYRASHDRTGARVVPIR